MTFSKYTTSTIPHHGKYNSRYNTEIQRAILHHWAGVNGGDAHLANPSVAVSANYLVYSDGRVVGQVPEEFRAWTSGSWDADAPSITIEIQNAEVGGEWRITPQAMSAVISLIADIAQRYSWGGVTGHNVRGHREFYATACPGPYVWNNMGHIVASANAVYNGAGNPVAKPSAPVTTNVDIERLANEVIAGLHGVGADRQAKLGANYAAVQARVNQILSGGIPSAVTSDNITVLANEVIAGKYGTGADRARALGANYNAVQARVNELLGVKTAAPAPQSVDINRLAQAVIRGEYSTGEERKRLLGANYAAVQARVNQILSGNANALATGKSVDTIAREVIAGNWGNGTIRVQRLSAAGYDYNAIQARVNQLV